MYVLSKSVILNDWLYLIWTSRDLCIYLPFILIWLHNDHWFIKGAIHIWQWRSPWYLSLKSCNIRQICKGRNVAPWRLSNVSFFLVFFQFFGKILVSFFLISFIYQFSVFQRFVCFLCFNDLTVFIVFQDFS